MSPRTDCWNYIRRLGRLSLLFLKGQGAGFERGAARQGEQAQRQNQQHNDLDFFMMRSVCKKPRRNSGAAC